MASNGATVSYEWLHENNGYQLLITAIVFLILNTIFVFMRFAARNLRTTASPPFGWDDLCILLGWLFAEGIAIDSIVAVHFGQGMRAMLWQKTSSKEKIDHWGRTTFYAGPIIYSAAVVFPKIAILLLYLRIFIDRFSRTCCWVLIVVLSLSCIVNTITVGFQCTTPVAAWHMGGPGSKCNNLQAHYNYGSLPNIITDVIMLALPLPMLAKLQVRRSTKIATFVAFGIASVGLISAVARFAEFVLHPIAEDPTYNGTTLYIWLTVEPGIYLMAACLISCRPLLTKVLASHFTVSVFSWTRKILRGSSTTGTAGATGVSNSTAEGDYYKLGSLAKPDQIHVREEFTVTARDNAV